MKMYKGEAIVTFTVPVIVVENNNLKAKEVVMQTISKALKSINTIDIGEGGVLTRLNDGEVLPEHLTENHYILLECGYPVDEVIRYSSKEAESEVQEISSNL